MKVLFFITGLGMGGAERQVCILADNFARLGCDVQLISLTGDTVNRPQSTSVKLIELKMTKTPLGLMRGYFRAIQLVKSFNPDVVHSHMIHANIFVRMLRLGTVIPRLICTAHSINEGGYMRMLAYRLTDSLCDLSTNVSQEAVNQFIFQRASKSERMIAMYNGIDTEEFHFKDNRRDEIIRILEVENNTPLLLAVGRLTEAKDYANLLNAFSYLLESYHNANLVIIGIGEQEEQLKQLAMQLNIAMQVHFLGLRHDICDWMSAADIYVMSSAWEGMPLVLLEAMACERVVVATDCGGVKEVVGDAGFLVPPRDSQLLADALVKALSLPIADKDKLTKLARSRVVERYSIDSVCKKWLSIYQGK